MRTCDLDFDLPDDLLATQAAEPRDAARLLVHDRATGQTRHQHVRDLAQLGVFQPGDLLLVNRSKVIPACFKATRAQTGGKMQGLYLHEIASPPAPGPAPSLGPRKGPLSSTDEPTRWVVLLESRGKLQIGETITLADDARLILEASTGPGQWLAQLESPRSTLAVLSGDGKLPGVGFTPLPPYIRKARKQLGLDEVTTEDASRYNTVFTADAARETGSVAAPTAGLHFTPRLLDAIQSLGVRFASITLHVGMGTFAPVNTDTLEAHTMHEEAFAVDEQAARAIAKTRSAGGKILCVGTTTVRAIESLPDDILESPRAVQASTDLFITPGFEFRFVDRLMTNFHLPQSTLLALVASLPGLGLDRLKTLYTQAIAEQYRFYSYGDAMLII